MPSSDSEDDRMQRVPRGTTVSAQQVPKKPNVVRNTVHEKRIQCSRLIRSNRCIIIIVALVFLLIIAIVLGVTLGTSKSTEEYDQRELIPLKWWQNSTIYRVYVTSFADSDGDGRGDFKGVKSLIEYYILLITYILEFIKTYHALNYLIFTLVKNVPYEWIEPDVV